MKHVSSVSLCRPFAPSSCGIHRGSWGANRSRDVTLDQRKCSNMSCTRSFPLSSLLSSSLKCQFSQDSICLFSGKPAPVLQGSVSLHSAPWTWWTCERHAQNELRAIQGPYPRLSVSPTPRWGVCVCVCLSVGLASSAYFYTFYSKVWAVNIRLLSSFL